MGAELTSLCTWVKHLPILLKNKANSRKQPRVYEDRRQKGQRTLRKQKVRGLLQEKKIPGTKVGTRATAVPGPPLPGLPQDVRERARLRVPSPAK